MLSGFTVLWKLAENIRGFSNLNRAFRTVARPWAKTSSGRSHSQPPPRAL